MKRVVTLNNPTPRVERFRFNAPIHWEINEGEQWAVLGANGSGKSQLAEILQGKIALNPLVGDIKYHFDAPAYREIKSVAFKDIHSLVDPTTTYYQQRWHSTEQDEVATVRDVLKSPKDTDVEELFAYFNMVDYLDRSIISLSSGELRKLLIIRILLTSPKILILDNPYIGLDKESREVLNDMFTSIVKINNLQLILLLSNPIDIPSVITHVMSIKDKCLLGGVTRSEFDSNPNIKDELFASSNRVITLPTQLNTNNFASYETAIFMDKINVRYGERIILEGLDWSVKQGESWALLGANGSGKSTLLSIVCADNPKAYSNSITLFDRKRGTGESIWDIKRRIGYISPEMHLYYNEDITTMRVVNSGFFDTIGLYTSPTEQQCDIALQWMHCLGIEHLAERSFTSLSSGEQRLALLARVFVKDPQLIILDEPLHGLDVTNKQLVIQVIEEFLKRKDKTLIYVTHYRNEIPKAVTKEKVLIKHA